MGADVYVFAERSSDQGWQPADLRKGRWHREDGLEAVQLYDFGRDYLIFFVLTGYEHYRLDASELPPPIVRRPRGRPVDLSHEVIDGREAEDLSQASWITPAEILTYDWHPLLALKPWWSDFLDRVAALEPPEDHRIVTWLTW